MNFRSCATDFLIYTNTIFIGIFSFAEQLKNTVTPWWKMSYQEQLEQKQKAVRESLTEIRRQMCVIKHLDLEVNGLHVG